jgi:DNA-binding transcriptional MerR regulator
MRPNTIEELEEKVSKIGENYNQYQKDLFYNSLHAGFTLEEIEEMLRECDYHGVKIYASSDRHWTVARSMQR